MTEQEFVDRWGQAEHYDSGEYTYADQREECLEDLHLLIDPMLVEAFVQGAHWFSCGYSGKSIPAARATRLLAAGKLGKVNGSAYLRRCGEANWGSVDGACGRFLPKGNWMRKDGTDGRGGKKGNAPLCWRCSE